jgi:hypothetical protein
VYSRRSQYGVREFARKGGNFGLRLITARLRNGGGTLLRRSTILLGDAGANGMTCLCRVRVLARGNRLLRCGRGAAVEMMTSNARMSKHMVKKVGGFAKRIREADLRLSRIA